MGAMLDTCYIKQSKKNTCSMMYHKQCSILKYLVISVKNFFYIISYGKLCTLYTYCANIQGTIKFFTNENLLLLKQIFHFKPRIDDTKFEYLLQYSRCHLKLKNKMVLVFSKPSYQNNSNYYIYEKVKHSCLYNFSTTLYPKQNHNFEQNKIISGIKRLV